MPKDASSTDSGRKIRALSRTLRAYFVDPSIISGVVLIRPQTCHEQGVEGAGGFIGGPVARVGDDIEGRVRVGAQEQGAYLFQIRINCGVLLAPDAMHDTA